MRITRFLRNYIFHDHITRNQIIELQKQLNKVQSDIENLKTQSSINILRNKTICSHESGISTEHYCGHEVIVSLTTFGERINNVHLPIESIMQGSIRPNHIILWLAEDEFKNKRLPKTLLLQQERGLEIAYCNDLKSYKKLIPSLKEFPYASVITIDDDVTYEFDLVERLVAAHIVQPNAICACRMHRIKLEANSAKPLSYLLWDHCVCDNIDSKLNFPTGVGGVLYPPHCFNDEVFNESVFMNVCPKADDIWFYIMALLNNATNKWVKTNSLVGYNNIVSYYPDSLFYYNNSTNNCGNDIQLQNVLKRYNIYLA